MRVREEARIPGNFFGVVCITTNSLLIKSGATKEVKDLTLDLYMSTKYPSAYKRYNS